MELGEILSSITKWAPIIVPTIAGLWVFYKYFSEGFHRPRIEFDIECNTLDSNQNEYLVEFILVAHNKGKIRFTFPELKLRIRGIKEKASLEFWKNSKRLKFPIPILNENIIPPRFKYYFVEPGVRQPINFITKIPKSVKYIVVHASFKYRFRLKIRLCPPGVIREKHTRERVFELPTTLKS